MSHRSNYIPPFVLYSWSWVVSQITSEQYGPNNVKAGTDVKLVPLSISFHGQQSFPKVYGPLYLKSRLIEPGASSDMTLIKVMHSPIPNERAITEWFWYRFVVFSRISWLSTRKCPVSLGPACIDEVLDPFVCPLLHFSKLQVAIKKADLCVFIFKRTNQMSPDVRC